MQRSRDFGFSIFSDSIKKEAIIDERLDMAIFFVCQTLFLHVKKQTHTHYNIINYKLCTLWLFNITMENHHF